MKYILIILALTVATYGAAQQKMLPVSLVEINRLVEPGEPSYGFQIGYQHQIFEQGEFYGFSTGFFDSFLTTDESAEEEGTIGETIANQFGLLFTGELRFLKKKNLYLNTSVLTGWGYRETKINLAYPSYGIDRDYAESYHFIFLGVDSRVGYRIKNKWGVQFFVRNDFSRAIDKYRSIMGEKPGFIYGYGLTYSW